MLMTDRGADFPDGCKPLERLAGYGREIEELHFLERKLPDACIVYDSADRARVRNVRQRGRTGTQLPKIGERAAARGLAGHDGEGRPDVTTLVEGDRLEVG